MSISFARRLFLCAGIYGVIVLVPLFFMERMIGENDPPAITHAEFYYGFICVTLAWQFVYLMMWRDPLRFRPMLIPAVFGKAGFAIVSLTLFAQERLKAENLVLSGIDIVLAGLFVWAFVALQNQPTGE